MPALAITIGIILTLIGVVSYELSGGASLTALIPSAFGVVLALLGFLARNEKRLKLAMHLAAVVALLGFLGSVRGLLRLPALIAGEPLERPAAVVAQSVMAALLLLFLALAIKSFVDVRRRRAR